MLVGRTHYTDKPIAAFVRLKVARMYATLSEVTTFILYFAREIRNSNTAGHLAGNSDFAGNVAGDFCFAGNDAENYCFDGKCCGKL